MQGLEGKQAYQQRWPQLVRGGWRQSRMWWVGEGGLVGVDAMVAQDGCRCVVDVTRCEVGWRCGCVDVLSTIVDTGLVTNTIRDDASAVVLKSSVGGCQ